MAKVRTEIRGGKPYYYLDYYIERKRTRLKVDSLEEGKVLLGKLQEFKKTERKEKLLKNLNMGGEVMPLPEAYEDQILSMHKDGKAYSEIQSFFVANYKEHLSVFKIAQIIKKQSSPGAVKSSSKAPSVKQKKKKPTIKKLKSPEKPKVVRVVTKAKSYSSIHFRHTIVHPSDEIKYQDLVQFIMRANLGTFKIYTADGVLEEQKERLIIFKGSNGETFMMEDLVMGRK